MRGNLVQAAPAAGPALPDIDTMRVVRAVCLVVVGALVLYPLFWLVLGSFQISPRGLSFSLKPYADIVSSPYFGEIVYHTAIMSVGTTALATVLGVPLAWIVARTDVPFKPMMHLLALIPFITPPMLGAISWSYLGSPNAGFINLLWRTATGAESPLINIYTMPGLIWVMALYLTPYAFLFTSIALEHMDPALENAAYISGSSPLRTTLTVTLPLMAPAIFSGALLVFIQSLEVFAIPAAIGTPGNIYVLTTEIYRLVQSLPPKFAGAAALSIPLLAVCAIALVLQMVTLGRGKSYATVGGKSFRRQLIALGGWRYVALAYAAFYLMMSAVLPYLVFLYGAFIKSSGLPPTAKNLTLRNFVAFFSGSSSELILRAIENSLILSVSGASIAIVLAAAVGYFINRGRWRGRALLDFLALVPVAIPGAVIAIGLLWAYIRPPFNLYGTLTILLLAYVTRYLPYGVKAVGTSIVQISEDLEKAARITGANWWNSFRNVLVPLLLPGLLAGWILMFISMMRELSASIMLFGSHTETLAVALYLLWDEALFSDVSILSLVIILLTLVPISIMRWLLKSKGIGEIAS